MFTREDNLRVHMRHHSTTNTSFQRSQRPSFGVIRCRINGCPKSLDGCGYSRRDKLTEHMWQKHAHLGYKRAGMHFCSVAGCPLRNGKGFSRRQELISHLMVEHPAANGNHARLESIEQVTPQEVDGAF
jgi:hypothetical protein